MMNETEAVLLAQVLKNMRALDWDVDGEVFDAGGKIGLMVRVDGVKHAHRAQVAAFDGASDMVRYFDSYFRNWVACRDG